jgi:hypothetical protein
MGGTRRFAGGGMPPKIIAAGSGKSETEAVLRAGARAFVVTAGIEDLNQAEQFREVETPVGTARMVVGRVRTTGQVVAGAGQITILGRIRRIRAVQAARIEEEDDAKQFG